ncbi:MAG: L,D-transpeptidase [Chthoniobacteraceae bacterium]
MSASASPTRVRILLLVSTVVLTTFCTLYLSSCASGDRDHKILVSVADQRMVLFDKEVPVASWLISTSKYGTGDLPGSYATPLGHLVVADKIGTDAPSGAVFHSRRWTGEIVRPNAPGRDPIVSRILWLKGTEAQNHDAYRRAIYIHGTPEESKIGCPASYGCIRMKSSDVITLYNEVGLGAQVEITNAHLPNNLLTPSPGLQSEPAGTGGE